MENPNAVPPFSISSLNPGDASFAESDPVQVVDPNNPRWGIWGALLVCLFSIAVQIVVPMFVIIPFALSRGLSPASPDFARSALELAITDRTAIFLQVLSVFPMHLLTLAAIWLLVTRGGKRPFFASLGWNWFEGLPAWLSLAVSVALGIVLFGIATALVKVLGADKPTQMEQLINSSMAARYAIVVLAVFSAPFIEEFIFRGVLYSALQRSIGVNGAIVLVFALFTLIHVPQYRENVGVIAAVAMLSLVLTIVRARSGQLLPCVAIHMAFNAVQAVLMIVEPHIQRTVPPTEPAIPSLSFLYTLIF